MNLNDKLFTLRKARNISQEELAAELMVSRQAVGKWENGQAVPETEKIIALSNFFGVSTDYLLKESTDGTDSISTPAPAAPAAPAAAAKPYALGVLTLLATIIIAAINVPSTTSWSTRYPSKLWFLIFAGRSRFPNEAGGLGLAPVFVFGALLSAFGLALIIYFLAKQRRHKKTHI